jgi:hypothetical protein
MDRSQRRRAGILIPAAVPFVPLGRLTTVEPPLDCKRDLYADWAWADGSLW